jgi:hypothetical protein
VLWTVFLTEAATQRYGAGWRQNEWRRIGNYDYERSGEQRCAPGKLRFIGERARSYTERP